jgi:hypothetical protein
MTTISDWKARLDEVVTLKEAEAIVAEALRSSDGEELATFLIDLFEEFIGLDPFGGELGTKQRIVLIRDRLLEIGYDIQGRFRREGRDFTRLEDIIRHG